MSIKVATWVWDNSRAEGTDRLVLLAIADQAHDDGSGAWPAVATIARKCLVSDRTVQRSIRTLEKLGELEIRQGAGPYSTNLYRVVMRDPERGDNLSPGDTLVTPGVSPVSPPPVTPVSPKPSLEPSIEPKDSPAPAARERARAAPRTEVPGFDEFYEAYPRRAGKQDALRTWPKAVAAVMKDKGIDQAAAIAGLVVKATQYRNDPNREDGYTAFPATWLNQGRWDDPPLPTKSSPRKAGPAAPTTKAGLYAGI